MSHAVYWPRTPEPGNFGDILTPIILQHYGIAHHWAHQSECRVLCTGSIIKYARPGVEVWGSGTPRVSDRLDPRATYRWVRGPLTAEIVRRDGGECPDQYGDPAMILPRIYPRTVQPTEEVGYFLHYIDMDRADRFPFVIDPLAGVETVLKRLWACRRIVSSSLHGIIAAHAYGIPAAWVKVSDRLTGDDTKFHDHAMAVGLSQMPLSTIDNPEFTNAAYCDQFLHAQLALCATRSKA